MVVEALCKVWVKFEVKLVRKAVSEGPIAHFLFSSHFCFYALPLLQDRAPQLVRPHLHGRHP